MADGVQILKFLNHGTQPQFVRFRYIDVQKANETVTSKVLATPA